MPKGSGRKPKGNFRKNSLMISMRMNPDVKTAIQKWADEHNRSFTQAMQELAMTGLSQWSEPWAVPAHPWMSHPERLT